MLSLNLVCTFIYYLFRITLCPTIFISIAFPIVVLACSITFVAHFFELFHHLFPFNIDLNGFQIIKSGRHGMCLLGHLVSNYHYCLLFCFKLSNFSFHPKFSSNWSRAIYPFALVHGIFVCTRRASKMISKEFELIATIFWWRQILCNGLPCCRTRIMDCFYIQVLA